MQRKMCPSCIYRPFNKSMLPKLEADVADPRMKGFFKGHRICHHSKDAVCAGFWARYKDLFTLGQIAQRLGFVKFVDDDIFKERR